MEQEALFSFGLWFRSIGMTPFERTSAENEVFGANRQEGQVSEELIPPFEASERKSSVCHSSTHLVASIVGGGVFTLPAVYQKCGVLVATFLILLIAVLTERSLYLVCLVARRAGVGSYPELAKVAFGDWAGHFVSSLLYLFLQTVMVAYFMLLSDLWVPLVQQILPNQQGTIPDCLILLACLALLSPFLVQREFRCVRIKFYATLVFILILCLALGINSKETILALTARLSRKLPLLKSSRRAETDYDDEMYESLYDEVPKLGSKGFGNILFALPLVTMSFLATSNIMAIQARLKVPRKNRVRRIIRTGVAASMFLMVLFGLIGCIAVGNDIQGNFLLNLSSLDMLKKDRWTAILLAIGRIGCGVLMLFATAIIMPQCRLSLLQIVDFAILKGTDDVTCKKCKDVCPEECCDEERPDMDEETCMSFPSISTWSTDRTPDVYVDVPSEGTRLLPMIEEEEVPPDCHIYSNVFAHYASTAGIAIFSYLVAVGLSIGGTSVLAIWSLVGSTMSFLVAFTLPAVCFIQIEKRQPIYPGSKAWLAFSWILAALSGLATLACTFQIIFAYACSCELGLLLFVKPEMSAWI